MQSLFIKRQRDKVVARGAMKRRKQGPPPLAFSSRNVAPRRVEGNPASTSGSNYNHNHNLNVNGANVNNNATNNSNFNYSTTAKRGQGAVSSGSHPQLSLQHIPISTQSSGSNGPSSWNLRNSSNPVQGVFGGDETVDELQMLREKLRELEEKNSTLEEDNFGLKSELLCRDTEEKHGKSKIIENLKSELSFTQRQLDQTTQALKNESKRVKELGEDLQQQQRMQQQQRARLQRIQDLQRQNSAPNSGSELQRTANKRRMVGGDDNRAPKPLQLYTRSHSTESVESKGISPGTDSQQHGDTLKTSLSNLSSTSIGSSSSSTTAPSLVSSTINPKQGKSVSALSSIFTAEDQARLLKSIDISNAVALSEGQIERVLVDELGRCLQTNCAGPLEDALEALLRGLGKCIKKRKPTLTDQLATSLLIPAFLSYFRDEKRRSKKERNICAEIAGFLTPLARQTRTSSQGGVDLVQTFAVFIKKQTQELELWLSELPEKWAQILELFSVISAIEAPVVKTTVLPDIYTLLESHARISQKHQGIMLPVIQFCTTLIAARPNYLNYVDDAATSKQGAILHLLRSLGDDGYESATWLRNAILRLKE